MTVRFSVLMPVYNREKYVRQAIDSVLGQTFKNFELFAIDDGSTDGSAEILKSYGDRIRFMQQRNQGPEVARNRAAALAQGEYLWMMDSDDFLFPHAMAIYDRVIRTFDSPPLMVGMAKVFRDGQLIPAETVEACPAPAEVLRSRDYLSRIRQLGANSIVMRRSVFNQVGGYRNSTSKTWVNDDYNLLLKAGTHGPCIIVQRPYTFAYRMHGNNSVGNVKAIAEGILLLARSERKGEYPGGSARRWDRYAMIGGRAGTWAYRYCWRAGERRMALRLFSGTAPMILAALVKRFLRCFRKPPQPIILPQE